MRSFDGSVEIQFALGNMAIRTLVVVGLWAAGVICPGGKIDVVVAGAAGSRSGPAEIGRRLCRASGLTVASLAPPHIRRIHHRGPVIDSAVEPDNLIRLSALDTGKIGAHVDLMWHDLKIKGVA